GIEMAWMLLRHGPVSRRIPPAREGAPARENPCLRASIDSTLLACPGRRVCARDPVDRIRSSRRIVPADLQSRLEQYDQRLLPESLRRRLAFHARPEQPARFSARAQPFHPAARGHELLHLVLRR